MRFFWLYGSRKLYHDILKSVPILSVDVIIKGISINDQKAYYD